jgi:3-isopropylmalate/(R)-2-methylmalate dehydratase large subunit
LNEIERYLAAAAGVETVAAGQDLTVKVDLVMAHDVTAPLALAPYREIGVDQVFDPAKVLFVIDHVYPAPSVQARQSHREMRIFAREFGFPILEGEGVCHQVISERYQLARGAIVVGADSHTCTAGAYGALAFGVGSTEAAAAMATGTLDIEVPEVQAVFLDGKLAPGVSAKDVILFLIGQFGGGGLTDQAILFAGSWVRQSTKDERMTISNMTIEMGAMLSYFSELADANAIGPLARTHHFDVGQIPALMAAPSFPANVKPIAELAGKQVSQVVIGSCTNGRISDMRDAATVFKHAAVDADVNCVIIPASRQVVAQMEEEGLTRIFRQAGATVTSPGCGSCYGGHMGLATTDDVVVSTTNRNFAGRMGAKTAQIYLASARSAAEAAVAGKIVVPGTVATLKGVSAHA